jgi:L-ribulose-5-phosphate 3-epimerase
MKENSRRDFIRKGTVAAAGVTLGLQTLAGAGAVSSFSTGNSGLQPVKYPVHVFTKCLQFLNYNQMSEMLAKQGFDGADMTVRPGGQVLPENVTTDLPKAVKALRSEGIGSWMITTSITDADDKHTRAILKAMADTGIKYYRPGWINYDHSKSMAENQENFKRIFSRLEKVNREFGVHGGYQNHSGQSLGAPVWDLYPLLKDCDPEYLGVQYDIRHATVEGAVSWPLGMKLVAPWIRSIDIKDFQWVKNDKGKWQLKNVPLGEGMVDFDAFFKLYQSLHLEGPVSIHYEYDLGGAEHGSLNPKMPAGEIAGWLKRDLDYLKGYLVKL